ncbi:membrane-bound transcription factor site-2 protease isoform X2 [Daktulosphaira vitifoliae]|uniref:membrane-bound transcription factor site-2 protease isoform X2 n=1 Tax=Daktulosphaira vitifoliae TaxID=58002 RepID=UPI0021A9BD5B|nr:membrane-bound transcription factor site-2 protease isoform X2 [Daktulosphaira vitifoliae]
MDLFGILITIVFFYVIILFLDVTFKSCSHYPYLVFLQKTGITIGPFQLQWYTTSFNRMILKMSFWNPKFQTLWFTFGSWVTICLIVPSICLVIVSCLQICRRMYSESLTVKSQTIFLEPIVPGINLPMSDFGYYVIALMSTTIFHELGHALAAIREDMHVEGVGMILVLILPVAYVHLEDITLLPSSKQLRVMSAGVWHNVFQGLMAYIILILLPVMMIPFYSIGSGVIVTNVDQRSGVYGKGGLLENDVITQLGDCKVNDYETWSKCLQYSLGKTQSGFCLSSEFVQEHDLTKHVEHNTDGTLLCCDSNTLSDLCFEYVESSSNSQELPHYSCLNVRKVIENSLSYCDYTNHCSSAHCYRPSLNNLTKLIVIVRQLGNEVLFLGQPTDLLYVSVTEYVPKTDYLSSRLPQSLEKLCKYLLMFAGGLAVINVIPCFYFDGEKISKVLVNTLLRDHIEHSSVRLAISLCFTFVGSLILLIYLLLGFWSLLGIIK